MAPALTKDITTRSTEGLPVSPPIVTNVETSVVRQPRSLKEDLQSRLLTTGFGISTQAIQLTTTLIVSPRERGKPLVVSSSRGNHRMNPPINGSQPDLSNSNLAIFSTKTAISTMGLTSADHPKQPDPKPSCSSKPDSSSTSTCNSSNGVNTLIKPFSLVKDATTTTPLNTPVANVEQEITTTTESHLLHSSVSNRRTLESTTAACETRQRQLQQRSEHILRRLRRLQNWQAISHVRQQMTGLVDYQQNTLHLQAKAIDGDDGKTTVLQDKNVKSLSTSALVNLVQSWQSRHGPPSSRSSKSSPEPEPQTKLDEDLCVELDRVGGNLRSNLHHLEQAVDSDATESSSGGESCDDMDYDDWDGKTPRPALPRRAEWLWSQERSRIAAKWTWLQAQVSDLEYRIRQQNDIFRQVRQSKGSVVLGDHPTTTVQQLRRDGKTEEASPLNVSQVLSNMDKQAATLTSQLGNVYSPAVSSSSGPANGLLVVPPSTSASPASSSSDTVTTVTQDTSCVAARCRPVKGLPRPRKLLRTAGLHLMSRKAARPSTVKCGCYPPRPSCAMCGGRYNNITTLLPYAMPTTEKLALLDPAYHPVLSFSQDAPLALQFEVLLKTGEWQQQKHPSKAYNKMMHLGSRTKPPTKEKPRKYNKQRIPKSVSAAMLNRIKSKYEQKQLGRGGNAAASGAASVALPAQKAADSNGRLPLKIRKRKGAGFGSGSGGMRKRARLGARHGNASSQHSSTLGNSHGGGDMASRSADSATLRDLKDAKKRRMENAFDINNIVIPYSIAAATRVEKLQYKEIATPKWRELGSTNNGTKATSSTTPPPPPPPVAPLPVPPVVASTPAPETTVPAGVKLIPNMDVASLMNGTAELPSETSNGGVRGGGEGSGEEEDISEEAITARHNRCEVTEKKKFLSYMVAQRRGRGHRTDSTSADAETLENGDDAAANLPSAATVIAELNMYSRQRQASCSLEQAASTYGAEYADDDDSQANMVPPWPPRSFPMCTKEFADMVNESEAAAAAAAAAAVQRRRSSVLPATSAGLGEEVVDEEWAVHGNTNKLVLRLTKR